MTGQNQNHTSVSNGIKDNQRYEPTIVGGDFFEPEIEEKKAKKSRSKPAVEDYKILLAECVRRKLTTEWSTKEISKLKELAKRQDFAAELDTIHASYTKYPASPPANVEGDYRRHGLETLLNNWPGEVDKCVSGRLYKFAITKAKSNPQLEGVEIVK